MTDSHPVEITNITHTPLRGNPENQTRLGHGAGSLPLDLPVSINITRHMKPGEDGVKGLIGHTLDLDAYTYDAKIQIKFVRGKMMVILLDGKEIGRVAK